MTRPIQVTLQLTLMVAPEVSRDELRQECNQRLRYAFESFLSDSPNAIQWIAIYDSERPLPKRRPQLASVLTNLGVASVVWCIDDVRELRPDLTREQAASVLDTIITKHDASCGIGWDTLEHFAEMLYGEVHDVEP